jgi:hypothetical protein
MPIIKRTKSGKVRCPVCEKLVEPYYDNEYNAMILDCCHKYTLYDKEYKNKREKKR